MFSIAAFLVCIASFLFPASAKNIELSVDSCSHKNYSTHRYTHTVFWKFNMPVKAVENTHSSSYRERTTIVMGTPSVTRHPMPLYIDNTEDCGYVKTYLGIFS